MPDDRPSSKPIDWRRSAAPVFRAAPLPSGATRDVAPTPPAPRLPGAPSPAPARPVNLFRDSLVPQAPRPALSPTATRQTPAAASRPDMTVRPLPTAHSSLEPAVAAPETASLPDGAEAAAEVPASAQTRRRPGPSRMVLAGGAAVAVAALALAAWALMPRTTPGPVAAPESVATAVPEAAVVSADPSPGLVEVAPPVAAAETPPPTGMSAPLPASQSRPAASVSARPDPEPAVQEPELASPPASEAVSETPRPPAIDPVPMVPARPAGPPPATEPTPRTLGDAIVTRPR